MPELGEIKIARQIGYEGGSKCIWIGCEGCGKQRWVELRNNLPRNLKCGSCSLKGQHNSLATEFQKGRYNPPDIGFQKGHTVNQGASHPNWRGGRCKTPKGYILINLNPDDFFLPMANKKRYVYEHRLVVARALGRCLQPWEIVHHKGTKYPKGGKEDKGDNRYPENLQLVSDERHKQITIMEGKIKHLQEKNILLETENIALREQLKYEFQKS